MNLLGSNTFGDSALGQFGTNTLNSLWANSKIGQDLNQVTNAWQQQSNTTQNNPFAQFIPKTDSQGNPEENPYKSSVAKEPMVAGTPQPVPDSGQNGRGGQNTKSILGMALAFL